MRVSHSKLSTIALLLAASAMIGTIPARAETLLHWDGDDYSNADRDDTGHGGSDTWDMTNTNWYFAPITNGNTNWLNSTDIVAVFGGVAGTVTLADTVKALRFSFTTTDYSIVQGAGGTITAVNTQTPLTIDTAPGVTATITATIEDIVGNTALDKTGSGTLVLGGANTYTGDVIVREGVLRVASATALGTADTGTVVLSGATLELANNISIAGETITLKGAHTAVALRNFSGDNTIGGNLVIEGDADNGVRLEIAAGSSLSLSGTLSDLGASHPLTVTGTGTLTLEGGASNTHAGITDITGTRLVLAKTGGTTAVGGNLKATDTTITLGASEQIADTAHLILAQSTFAMGIHDETLNYMQFLAGTGCSVTGAGTLTITSGIDIINDGENSIAPKVAGGASLFITGGSGLTLSNTSNSFTGLIDIDNGELIATSAGNIGTTSALGSGSATGTFSGANGMWLGKTGGHTGTLTLNGTIDSSTDRLFTLKGDGVIRNNGTGVLRFTNSSAIALGTGSHTLTLGGGNGDDNTFAPIIGDSSGATPTSLQKVDAGHWILSGNNTYSGATSVNAGTLEISHANALGSTTGGTTVAAGATLAIQGSIAVGAESLTLSGNGVGDFGALRNKNGDNSWSGNITLAADAAIRADYGSTLSLTGEISGAHNLTVEGSSAGTLTLGGATSNTLSGITLVTGTNLILAKTGGAIAIASTGIGVSNAKIILGADEQIADGATLNLGAGSTFAVSSHNETLDELHISGNASVTGNGTLTISTLTSIDTSGTMLLAPLLAGAGRLDIVGGSTVTLGSKDNSYTGATIIGGGAELIISKLANGGQTSSLGTSGSAAGNLAIRSGTLTYQNTAATAGEVATDRLFTVRDAATINHSGTGTGIRFTNTGAIEFISLTTPRDPVITFGGDNTGDNRFAPQLTDYTAEAKTTSVVKADSGQWILEGANTYSGGTAVNAGTLVTAGTSALGAGSVTVSGATARLRIGDGTANTVTLASGANLVVSNGGSVAMGGSDAQINLTGTGTFDFTGGSVYIGSLFDANPTISSYHLITGGTGSGIGTSQVTGYDHNVFSDVSLNNSGYLVFTAIPEPATCGLSGAGVLAGLAYIRRRRRNAA